MKKKKQTQKSLIVQYVIFYELIFLHVVLNKNGRNANITYYLDISKNM